jgi:hypothetical protein
LTGQDTMTGALRLYAAHRRFQWGQDRGYAQPTQK